MNKEMIGSNCLNMQFELLNGLFFDNREETDEYLLCTSKTMDDYFWNLVYFKNKINNEMLEKLEKEFNSINRKPSIYINRDDDKYLENRKAVIDRGYILKDADVYMELDEEKTTEINTNIKVVENEKEYNDFMKVLASAYNDTLENSEENVYADAVTDCYYTAVKNTINSKEHIHIIVYDNGIPVSVATLNYVDNVGSLNNVGTAQGYWNKGYGKQLMTYIINKFHELGGEKLILCTEYKSKNQLFYEKLGFVEKYVIDQYVKE